MNAEQATTLCRMAKSISPGQAVDDYTPAAWALILEDVDYDDARQALKQLGSEQEWLHVSHVCQRVKRIRSARVKAAPEPIPPAGLTEAEEREWRGQAVKALADGRPVTDARALPSESDRDVSGLGEVGIPVASRIAAAREAMRKQQAAQEAQAEDRRLADRAERTARREQARKDDQEAREALRQVTETEGARV